MLQAFIFDNWMIFDKVMRVYTQKLQRQPLKILLLVPFQVYSSPLKVTSTTKVFSAKK